MDGQIGIQRIGLGDNQQVMAACQLQGDAREGFQMARLAGADLASALGNDAHLAALARIERKQTVGLTPVSVAEDDSFNTE